MSLPPGPGHTGVTAVSWVLRAPLERADLPRLCDQLRMLIARTGATVVVCDVGDCAEPDVVVVETLARLQLTARRAGAKLELARAGPELRLLLALLGLRAVVSVSGDSRGQAEEREEARGVEEIVDPGDPAG